MKRSNKKAWPLLVGHVIKSESTNHDEVAVWCPYCKRHHYHGWNRENKVDDVEHRCAHCDYSVLSDSNSPLKEKGYYIGIEPKVK